LENFLKHTAIVCFGDFPKTPFGFLQSGARRVAKFWVPLCQNPEIFQVSKKYFSKSKTFAKIPKLLQRSALRGRNVDLC
jgi:hypothetical protein